MELIIKEIGPAVMEGDSGTAQEKVQASLPASETLNGMIAAMAEVDKLFEEGEYFVPEMLISAGFTADASRAVAAAKSLISVGDIR
jgi:5-methyltetrahydrofolate--homocysteine methyltransferase